MVLNKKKKKKKKKKWSLMTYRIYPKYFDRQIWANLVDSDQMPWKMACDRGFYCLLLI